LDNKFNVLEGLHRNWYFLFINAVTIAGQVAIIFFGGDALSTVRLTPKEWDFSLLFGALSLPMGAVIRLIPDGVVAPFLSSRIAVHQDLGGIRSVRARDVEEDAVARQNLVSEMPAVAEDVGQAAGLLQGSKPEVVVLIVRKTKDGVSHYDQEHRTCMNGGRG
jgi:hypothetical protein